METSVESWDTSPLNLAWYLQRSHDHPKYPSSWLRGTVLAAERGRFGAGARAGKVGRSYGPINSSYN